MTKKEAWSWRPLPIFLLGYALYLSVFSPFVARKYVGEADNFYFLATVLCIFPKGTSCENLHALYFTAPGESESSLRELLPYRYDYLRNYFVPAALYKIVGEIGALFHVPEGNTLAVIHRLGLFGIFSVYLSSFLLFGIFATGVWKPLQEREVQGGFLLFVGILALLETAIIENYFRDGAFWPRTGGNYLSHVDFLSFGFTPRNFSSLSVLLGFFLRFVGVTAPFYWFVALATAFHVSLGVSFLFLILGWEAIAHGNGLFKKRTLLVPVGIVLLLFQLMLSARVTPVDHGRVWGSLCAALLGLFSLGFLSDFSARNRGVERIRLFLRTPLGTFLLLGVPVLALPLFSSASMGLGLEELSHLFAHANQRMPPLAAGLGVCALAMALVQGERAKKAKILGVSFLLAFVLQKGARDSWRFPFYLFHDVGKFATLPPPSLKDSHQEAHHYLWRLKGYFYPKH